MFDIAALVAKMKTDVALIVDDVLTAAAVTRIFAVVELLVHQRRIIRERFFDGVDRGKFVIIDFNQPRRLLCNRSIGRRNRGNHAVNGRLIKIARMVMTVIAPCAIGPSERLC